jgi:hypothetical protein
MKKGETTKACPGCGEEGIRNANEVCWHCKKLLEEARTARARQEQDTAYQVYDIPATFPWYYAPDPYGQKHEELRRHEETLRALMKTLVHSIGTRAVGTEIYNPDRSKLFTFPKGRRLEYSFYDSQLLLKPETAHALDELDTTLQAALVAAYEDGKRAGAHLLHQLASGDITVATFNERVG